MTLDQRVAQQSVQGLLNDDYSCYIGEEPSDTPCDQVGNQIVRVDGPTGVSFIEDFYVTTFNQYEQKGQFIDVSLSYNLLTEFGTFDFEGAYNNIVSLSQKLTPDSEKDDLKNDPITGGWQPRASFAGSVTWSYHDFATTLTMIYRGSTTVYNCTTATNGCISNVTGEDYYETENWWLDSYTTFNWTASYNWTDDFQTSLRVVNLFDEKPPKDDTMDFFDNPWYNTFVYPGAGIGRYFALQASYTF
jgi:outer membrane receptor protein involved in Fe transport